MFSYVRIQKNIGFQVYIMDYDYYEELPDGVEGVLGHDGGLDAPRVQIPCAHNLTRSSVRQNRESTYEVLSDNAAIGTLKLQMMSQKNCFVPG